MVGSLILSFLFAIKPQTFGIGIILGQPTGLSFAYVLSKSSFVDLSVAWAIKNRFHLNGDYLTEWVVEADTSELEMELPGRFTAYLGPGFSFEIGKDRTSYVGIRASMGLRYEIPNYPMDIFLEVAPGVRLIPDTEAFVEGGIGGRFYFFKKPKE